ncbi:hypothetical protein H4582DRAFT_1894632 [Lactarius indigo]|nr:hypothetical protein H4582DRAFT_1894632 [Lactarius indigo]
MKNLWHFTRGYNEPGNPMPLPTCVSIAFTNPEMICRIRKQRDLAVRVIGRCVEALVVNKLAADIKSRDAPVSNAELACLSAILGTKSDDLLHLLRHPGAIELTNIIFLAWANIDTSASTNVPSDVLDVIQQTFGFLSQALPAELNTVMRLDRTGALVDVSNGTKSFTTEMYLTVLRGWMKDLWDFTRGYNESGDSVPLPTYVSIAFANPEVARRIREQHDLAIRVIGRCIGALVVNKLAADIKSHDIPAKGDELACLSAILGTKNDEAMLMLSHPGAIEFTNMIFLALDNFYFFTLGAVPPFVLDTVQQTSSTLSRALPPELNAKLRPNEANTPMSVSDATSSLTVETYMSVLRGWMKNLWHFTREYNERGNSVPLPPYVFVAFANPELTRRIRKQCDLAVRVIARCTEALVVNKLAADIKSRDIPATNDELACLSAILGTKNDDVMLLLSHAGAVEFTNMVFLTLDDFVAAYGTVPSYALDVIQQTSSALSHDLPPDLKLVMRLRQKITLMNASDVTSSLTGNIYMNILRGWAKNLWRFTREYNERGNSVPLPTYVPIAFTNPEMIRRICEQRDLAVCVIGRCTQALVVAKLAADIESRDAPASEDKLACLSAILGTESHDVGLCLSQLGTIQLVNLASLALGFDSSLQIDQMPPNARHVLQQTLTILSQTIRVQANAEHPLNQTVALVNVSGDNGDFARTILFHLHNLLKMLVPGASSLVEEVRTSCLRMCLKTLWHCAKAYHQTTDPLPSYGSLVLAAPEITRLFRTEQDLVARIIGSCFGALVVDKLMDALESPISPSGRIRNAEMARISAILGTTHREVLLLPHQLRVINLWNVVSLMSGGADTLSNAAGLPGVVPKLVQDTLHILVNRLRDHLFVSGWLPIDQWRLLQKRYSDVVKALGSEQLRNETVDQLQQLLEKLLPGVEGSQDTAIQSLDH